MSRWSRSIARAVVVSAIFSWGCSSSNPAPPMLPHAPTALAAAGITVDPMTGGIVPTHVLTADWLGFERKGKFPWSTYAPYLSWAEPAPLFASAIAAVGIKTMYYTNPNRQKQGGDMYTPDETTFAHDCSANRVDDPVTGLDLMEPSSTHLQNLWVAVAQQVGQTAHYDAYEEDGADDIYQLNTLPCGYTPSDWLNRSIALAGAFKSAGYSAVYNGLSILGPGATVSPTIALNAVTSGGMMEGCYVRPGTSNFQPAGQVWQTIENTELIMAKQDKRFFCYADNWQFNASDPVAISLRSYVYASYLLTYRLGASVLWESFLTPSGFRVNPETQIVATGPKIPSPATIAGLLTSGGLYAREYDWCFLHGVGVGRCAAVVNPDPFHAHPFPYTGYGHTMVLSGSGVLDGGSVSIAGAAPPSSVPPLTGIVAFK